MKIRIVASTTISDGQGHRYRQGQVADVDDELAHAWIEAGHATEASRGDQVDERPEPVEPETATNEPPKSTATRTSRKSTK